MIPFHQFETICLKQFHRIDPKFDWDDDWHKFIEDVYDNHDVYYIVDFLNKLKEITTEIGVSLNNE